MRMRFDPYSKPFRLFRFFYHLPKILRLAWRLFVDTRIPAYLKLIPVLFAGLTIVFFTLYFIVRFDLVPDFLPILGKLDDPIVPMVVVMLPGLWVFIQRCPRDIVLEHVRSIEQGG